MAAMAKSGPVAVLAGDLGGRLFYAVLLAAAVLVPLLNLAVPEGSLLHLSGFSVTLIGKYMTYALLAIAVDLIWGYCGILSLGHAAFFALGGYAMGMYLMRQIGSRGVYGDPLLPDFMVFLNWKALPWYWHGFESFPFAMLMVVLAPGLLAFAFGWTPCIGPILGAILAVAASQQTVGQGAGLLGIYSLGLAVPFWLAAAFSGLFMAFLIRFRRHLGLVEKILGGLLVLTGLAFIFGYVGDVSTWFQQTFPVLMQIG